jgi:hypothetical protein
MTARPELRELLNGTATTLLVDRAFRCGLLDRLGTESASYETLSRELGVDEAELRELLGSLVACGLLDYDGISFGLATALPTASATDAPTFVRWLDTGFGCVRVLQLAGWEATALLDVRGTLRAEAVFLVAEPLHEVGDDVFARARAELPARGVFVGWDVASFGHVSDDRDHPLGPALRAAAVLSCVPRQIERGIAPRGAMGGRAWILAGLARCGFTLREVVVRDRYTTVFIAERGL